ncbi:CGNR zinc finger domain-containing protein [Nonomuraea recticatena]|uniref:CGNR zinc finger domain-containing protein n=1 Tax=Nonomuraea recticatena TaxID=46178 RepID=UPI00361DB466
MGREEGPLPRDAVPHHRDHRPRSRDPRGQHGRPSHQPRRRAPHHLRFHPCNRYLLRHGRRHWCSIRCGDRARAARAYARRTQSKPD